MNMALSADIEETLWKAAVRGLRHRFRQNVIPRTQARAYLTQLRHEVNAVLKAGSGSHFLAAAELVEYLRQHKYGIGPGHGLLTASLLAYALGIHAVDPIRFGLIFELFYRTGGVPRFSLNVCPDGYAAAKNYLCDKYGAARIAWDGYGVFSSLLVSICPLANCMKIIGRRSDFPVVDWGRHSNLSFIQLCIQIVPSLLLGRISRTWWKVRDAYGEDMKHIDTRFEDYVLGAEVWIDGSGLADLHAEMTELGVRAEPFIRFGVIRNIDEAVLAFYLGYTKSCEHTDLLINRYLSDRESLPWDGEAESWQRKFLGETCGLLVYQEQIIRMLSAFGGLSLADAIETRRKLNSGDGEYIRTCRAAFVDHATTQGHSAGFSGEFFDFMCYRNQYCFPKAGLIGPTLLLYQAVTLKGMWETDWQGSLC